MKKLLSLLSLLTISGTVIPTTIAASPYQKNNLETLNRKKEKIIKHSNNKKLSLEQVVLLLILVLC